MTKDNKNKPRLGLIPFETLYGVANVLEFGAIKYGEHNWRSDPGSYTDYLSAAMRHIAKFLSGTDNDEESGLNHLDHAICSLLFIRQYQIDDIGTDDRHSVARAMPDLYNRKDELRDFINRHSNAPDINISYTVEDSIWDHPQSIGVNISYPVEEYEQPGKCLICRKRDHAGRPCPKLAKEVRNIIG